MFSFFISLNAYFLVLEKATLSELAGLLNSLHELFIVLLY